MYNNINVGPVANIKVIGVGGGGNTGMVNTKDYDDIFYLADDSVTNDVLEFLLKII